MIWKCSPFSGENWDAVLQYLEEVQATMNKEEWNSNIAPFLPFVCRFEKSTQAVPQGMVRKQGKIPT